MDEERLVELPGLDELLDVLACVDAGVVPDERAWQRRRQAPVLIELLDVRLEPLEEVDDGVAVHRLVEHLIANQAFDGRHDGHHGGRQAMVRVSRTRNDGPRPLTLLDQKCASSM